MVSAPDTVTGHSQPTSLPETPGHSQDSLDQSLVGSLLLSPGYLPNPGIEPRWILHQGSPYNQKLANMHWRRKWQPTLAFLLGESQGWGSLLGSRLQGRTELDTNKAI